LPGDEEFAFAFEADDFVVGEGNEFGAEAIALHEDPGEDVFEVGWEGDGAEPIPSV